MEMPTPCQKCGGIFELLDGMMSEKWYRNIIICEPCGREEEAEIERDDEISSLKEEIEEAEYTIRHNRERLAALEAGG